MNNFVESAASIPVLYRQFASWWPLISAPEDYDEEAEFFYQLFMEHSQHPPKTLLELGSGGGNNACYLKRHFHMTLVDRSAGMLAVSRSLNPECEHIQGDMRNLALQREFDGVFIHDAIVYLTTPQELRQALETAYLHCQTNGIVVIAPDYIRETFVESTTHGGHDGPDRAARYLSWTYDPDPQDTTYVSDMVYTLRTAPDRIEVVYDRHVEGLFPLQLWLSLLSEVGFDPKVITDPFERQIFVGVKCPPEN